jgi:hypothetical protein
LLRISEANLGGDGSAAVRARRTATKEEQVRLWKLWHRKDDHEHDHDHESAEAEPPTIRFAVGDGPVHELGGDEPEPEPDGST